MKLSVIIPCLNAEATLAVQLQALTRQQWSEAWELIIADNGSTDNSVKIARGYENRFPVIRIIKALDKKRQSYALNSGIRAAIGDRLAFCDADDEVDNGWLAAIGDALSDHDVVYGRFRFDKFNDPLQAENADQRWKGGLHKGRFLPGGGAGNLGIKRRVHEAIGGFDECLPRFADADYYWRLQLEGFDLHYVPEAIVQVRKGRVNPTLPYLFRRGRTASATNCWTYKKYRHLGMLPPNPFKNSLIAWLRILRAVKLVGSLNKERRHEWVKSFFTNSGDLIGQLQGRMTNPCKPYCPSKRSYRDRGP